VVVKNQPRSSRIPPPLKYRVPLRDRKAVTALKAPQTTSSTWQRGIASTPPFMHLAKRILPPTRQGTNPLIKTTTKISSSSSSNSLKSNRASKNRSLLRGQEAPEVNRLSRQRRNSRPDTRAMVRVRVKEGSKLLPRMHRAAAARAEVEEAEEMVARVAQGAVVT